MRIRAVRRGLAVLAIAAGPLFAASGFAFAGECSDTPAASIDWSECNKKNLMLSGSDFRNAHLYGADLSLTDLSGSVLTGANFEKAALVRAWLTRAKADGVNFSKVEAYRSGFESVSAAGASFVSAELQRANFKSAQLSKANFSKAELGRANFSGADLSGAIFAFANLSRADLSHASFKDPIVLDRAFLYLTHIEGLDLSAAKGLEQAQVDLACGDGKTKLPSNLSTPTTWPCGSD